MQHALLRRCSKIKRWILSRQVFTVSAIGPRGGVGGLHIVGGLPWRSRLMQMMCVSGLLQSPWQGSSAQAARHRQGKVLQQDGWAENQGCWWCLCSCCIKLKGIVKRKKRILVVLTVWVCETASEQGLDSWITSLPLMQKMKVSLLSTQSPQKSFSSHV